MKCLASGWAPFPNKIPAAPRVRQSYGVPVDWKKEDRRGGCRPRCPGRCTTPHYFQFLRRRAFQDKGTIGSLLMKLERKGDGLTSYATHPRAWISLAIVRDSGGSLTSS